MTPFGHFRPDAESINAQLCVDAQNVYPSIQGFKPFKGPSSISTALDGRCRGAVSVIVADGSSESFAGDGTKLYQLGSGATWADVTRSGDPYATALGERWRFDTFGDLLLATNFTDEPQKFDMTSSTEFEDLGGSPPKARYIAVIREFVFLGCLFGDELAVQWCSIGDAEEWTPGTNSGDKQVFPSGGPVRGLIGGESGYIFQDQKITRATYAPGTDYVFQFDEVEGGRGLKAPGSLVRLAREAFYFAGDNFYKLDLGSGSSQPIGIGKWAKWFVNDLRAGTENEIIGAVDPRNSVVMWAYISRNNSTTTPDRILLYDWTIDEATYANVDVEELSQWLSLGVTLDAMNDYGTLDDLPYSLDSPFWRGGRQLLGLFGTDHKLAYLQGNNLQAQIETTDGSVGQRVLITGLRPQADTTTAITALAMTERDGDVPAFTPYEAQEDTGVCPQWQSGNLARARIQIPAAANWTFLKGLETVTKRAGKR